MEGVIEELCLGWSLGGWRVSMDVAKIASVLSVFPLLSLALSASSDAAATESPSN